MNSFFYPLADSKLLEKIQLDQPNKALTLFFHEEKLVVDTRASLERTLKTLKRFEKEGELFCRKRDVTLTKRDNEKERSVLCLSGNLNDALSLLLGKKIITNEDFFELSKKLDIQKGETKNLNTHCIWMKSDGGTSHTGVSPKKHQITLTHEEEFFGELDDLSDEEKVSYLREKFGQHGYKVEINCSPNILPASDVKAF